MLPATELSRAGIAVGKATLPPRCGRVDPNSDNIFQRFRDCRISRTEAMDEDQWRRNQNVGQAGCRVSASAAGAVMRQVS
jgi:hypothetical protein